MLTPEQVSDRVYIMTMVDAPECESCHCPIPDGAASDSRWFVDCQWSPSTDDGVVTGCEATAIIRCPDCW